MDITAELKTMGEESYRNFSSALMPTVPKEKVIGIRVPLLRRFARKLKGNKLTDTFMENLPHSYYEEDNLHAFLIEQINEPEKCIAALDVFLPFVDNWATCDMMVPQALYKNISLLMQAVNRWLDSGKCYTVRYGIGVLMRLLGTEAFDASQLQMVADIKSDEYYVNMMRAWYFATAFALRCPQALPYITEHRLDKWTHNKAIQKAIESRRVSQNIKNKLKQYRLR